MGGGESDRLPLPPSDGERQLRSVNFLTVPFLQFSSFLEPDYHSYQVPGEKKKHPKMPLAQPI